MDLAGILTDFRSLGVRNVREGAHVLRGTARAATIAAHNAITFGLVFGDRAQGALSDEEEHELRRQIGALYDVDWQNVEEGLYPASLAHDFSWWRIARLYPRLAVDARRIRDRALRGAHDELPPEASSYPKYYRRNFHFQTDGYLGQESAALYEAQVELLFVGTADAMRRQVLPPIVRALRERDRAGLRILDVACGTGPMLRLLSAALPGAGLFGVDLSPHYIAYARQVLKDVLPLSLVVENAERLPFVDGYFDAVTNIFLMHEIPPSVRDRVLREIHRVLAPGGVFVLADSVQPGDLPLADRHLTHFPEQFHEPFYRQYLHDDVASRIARAGFEVLDQRICFLTKVIAARRASRPRTMRGGNDA